MIRFFFLFVFSISIECFSKATNVQYDLIFEKTREVLKQSDKSDQIKIAKSVPESAVVEYLQNHPDKLKASAQELIKIVKKESKIQNDPTKHLRLIPPKGMPGYSNLKVFVSHPYYLRKKLVPASNLVQVWSDFLEKAKKKIILNIFDFDLEQVAQILVKKARSGVDVIVGIDAGTIQSRPEVARIRDELVKGRVKVTEVDSVHLDHQKMAAIDWDNPQSAQVLFSSGNLTQSCLGPEGDLKNIPASKRPARSIPNANHVITLDSWLLANLVSNELIKTLDKRYHYRGKEYPQMGSYQITGPGVNPQTFEAYPENSLIISFSPEGGFRKINKNIIGHFIQKSTGPIRMIQFAFSSKDVTEALVGKAQVEGSKFDFMSVGDTPFAMQKWSQFLQMSGIERITNSHKEKEYVESSENTFRDVLGEENFKKLRSHIRTSTQYYSTGKVTIDGKEYEVSAKVHHKILSAAPFAIMGTSFNFSNSAQNNNEQILVFKNAYLVQVIEGMTKWLSEQGTRSVYEEAVRRNKFVKNPEHKLLAATMDMNLKESDDDSNNDLDEDSSETRQAIP
jgi:phosphatidylserine/phosphatidylglycerophosphate/cardiolipin synthase-like enzyme